jgi:HSP20 family molecular chaperone IbpA
MDPFERMVGLLRFDPFRALEEPAPSATRRVLLPDVEFLESKDAYVVVAALRGARAVDLDLSIVGQRMVLRERAGGERASGSFTLSFELPEGADVQRVLAKPGSDVLTLRIPKKIGRLNEGRLRGRAA